MRSTISGLIAEGNVITATPGLGELYRITEKVNANEYRYQYGRADLIPKT